MDINHHIYPLLGSYNLHTVKRTLTQVERFDKLQLIVRNLFLLMTTLNNLNRLIYIYNLNYFRTRTAEMCLKLRMRLDQCLQCLDKQFDIYILRKTCNDRSVVDSGFRLFDGINIYSHLCV